MKKKKARMRNQHTHSYQHTSPHPVGLDYTHLDGKLFIITNYGATLSSLQNHIVLEIA